MNRGYGFKQQSYSYHGGRYRKSFLAYEYPQMPKQFIDVLGCGRTLLQLTVDRFQDICPSENIWVVTSVDYADVVKEQLPSIPVDHILLEPCRRNTAPCIAYVSWKIKAKNPKANIVVTPSDHVVMDVREFARVINSAMKFTADSDAIVTLGMKANRPETGYGYIEADLSMACPSNKEIYRVDAFKEKPDLEVARRYIQRKIILECRDFYMECQYDSQCLACLSASNGRGF